MASRSALQALRASPVAGPSRIPLRAFSTTQPARAPTTDICVRTSRPMPSILHAFAVLREVESKYGRVVNFDVPRDPDNLQPTNILFIKLLDPIEVGEGSKRALHEIPAPVSSVGKNEIFGGPSFEDIQTVLSGRSTRNLAPGRNSRDNNNNSSRSVITFEVEQRKNTRARRYERDPTTRHVTPKMLQEDEQIVAALERFGGGFFGGFEGVAAKHRALLESRKRQQGTVNASAAESESEAVTEATAVPEDEAELAEPAAARG